MLCDDLLRSLLQVPGAGVVAEAFPKLVDLFRTRFCHRLDGWQFTHPAVPVRNHGFDLRLLEHDFRDPDGIRIAGAPPRQVAGILREPAEQRRDQPA